MGMGMGVNPYPPVYMGDPVGLFLCRGYVYGVVIPGGYLPIAISNHVGCLGRFSEDERKPRRITFHSGVSSSLTPLLPGQVRSELKDLSRFHSRATKAGRFNVSSYSPPTTSYENQ
jgi:hypothetical protein